MDKNAMWMTFPAVLSTTVGKHGSSNAYAFAGEQPKTWEQVGKDVVAVTAFLEKNGIVPGDKVAILSTNMPNWPVAFLAVTSMGAVAVPILPDFSPGEVRNVITHSETKAVFVSAPLYSKLEGFIPDNLRLVIAVEDFSIIQSKQTNFRFDASAAPDMQYTVDENDLASIIYTSGTTGKSKGVMLTHKNIVFNAIMGSRIQKITSGDRFLSVLPLSHTYENTLGLVLPMLEGAAVYYLRKPPSPAVLLPALQEVKPTMMLTVPLIIEKIYFNKILPAFTDKWALRKVYGIAPVRKLLNAAAGRKLMKTFGGQLKFFGIGGAKLNRAVERFLREARFPYAVGYGLTETSPLLAGSNPGKQVFESTGPSIDGIELKINNPDPITGEGEIWAKGPNVMKGYYRETAMTEEVITPDGWFRTGDLGTFDGNNNLYIKGRLKNMIVGSSGENIYPEEIESVINNYKGVVESLVIQQKGKLVALVHINREELEKKYQAIKDDMTRSVELKLDEFMSEVRSYVNSRVNKFSQIQKVIYQQDPFQKTATLKIKRFLYT